MRGRGGRGGLGLKQAGRQARLQSRELCDHNRHCPCWPHPLRLAVAARRRKQRVEVGSRRRSCWQLRKNNQRCTVWAPGGLGGGREPFVEPPRTRDSLIFLQPLTVNGNGTICIYRISLRYSRSYSLIYFLSSAKAVKARSVSRSRRRRAA